MRAREAERRQAENRESSVDQQKFYCLQYDTVYTVSITITCIYSLG